MPRSSKDSTDDDEEPKAGRIHTRKFASQSIINSPLRRSNRLKQTMESTSIETLRGTRCTRTTSLSFDISDTTDIEGVSRRATRRSVTTSSPSTRITRTLSKRLSQAGSEAKALSLSPPLRTTPRRTRASSADVESVSVKIQDDLSIPIKLCKQITTSSSCSSVKKSSEEKRPLTYLNDIISETEEYTDIENSNSTPDKMSHIDKKDKKENLDTEQGNSEDYLLRGTVIDEDTPDTSSSPLKKRKNDKTDSKITGLSEVQISLIDVRKKGRELAVKMENTLTTSVEEDNRSLSNKENQMLNVISLTPVAKSIQPITTLPSLSTDHFTSSANVHKTANEEENKSVLNEASLGKQLYLRESTEATTKQSTLPQNIDSNENKMDISINSLSVNLSDNKSESNNSLRSDTSDKQISIHDVDDEPSIDNTNTLLLPENKSVEIIDEVINVKEMSIENKSEDFEDTEIKISNKSDKTEDLIITEEANYTKQLSNYTESLPTNDKNSEDNQSIVIQSIVSQDDVGDNNFSKEKQETLHEELDRSYTFSEIVNSSSKHLDANSAVQDNQSPDIPKTSEESVTKIANDTSDVDIGIELFQDVPAEKWETEMAERNNEVGPTSQLENLETETDCDLILEDMQVWSESKNIKEAKEKKLLEHDSDDTVLLESQLEATKASSSDAKRSNVSNQETDSDSKNTKRSKLNEKRKLLTKRKSTSQKDKNSSSECEEEKDNLSISNTSSEQPEIAALLDQCKEDRVAQKTTSEQANTIEQTSGMCDQSDEEIKDDAHRSHGSLPTNKKNTPLRKSTEKRELLNTSVKDTFLKQSDMQEVYTNQSLMDISGEDLDNMDTHVGKKAKKKRSLNKSNNIDTHSNIITEKETISPSKDNIEEGKGFKNDSTLAATKSSNTDSSNNSESVIPQFLFAQSSEDDSKDDGNDSMDSDIKKEYNLSGVKQKFPDNDVPADECRDSEEEFSDPDDHGSDLVNFIVDDEDDDDDDDDDIENEKIEEENEDVEKEDSENKYEQCVIKNNEIERKEAEYDQAYKNIEHSMESDDEEDADEENDKVEDAYKENFVETIMTITDNVTEKSKINKKKKRQSIEIVSPNESKLKQYVKTTKSPGSKTETLTKQIDTSVIELKKLPVEILGCNTSKLNLQNKKSQTVVPEVQSDDFISSNVEINKHVTFVDMETDDQNVKRNLKKKHIKSDTTDKSVQNTSIKKEKPIKISVLKRDINLGELNYANSERKILSANSANDVIQENSQQKQRKRKRQKKTWDEDSIDELVLQDTKELNVLKKKRCIKVDSPLNIKNTDCEYTCYVKEKEKKEKHKDRKVNKVDILQEDMHRNKTELLERNKNKTDKITNTSETKFFGDDYMLVKEQIIYQNTKEKKEILPKQLSKKNKKKEDTSSLQTRVVKLKSENLKSNNKVQLQNAELEPTSSKVQKKRDFCADNTKILKKKIKCQKIAENKETVLEKLSEKKKKTKKDKILSLYPEVMKLQSDALPSNKEVGSRLKDSIEPQNEETNFSTDNYMVIKKKQKRKTVNSKEALPDKLLKKKKKAKKILPEIGIPTSKEQESADSKETFVEKVLKKKTKAKHISSLESEIPILKSDNIQLNELQSQNYKSKLAVPRKTQDENKDLSIVSYKGMDKKIKRQKTVESRECFVEKLPEKKKKNKGALKAKIPKTKCSKLKSHDSMSYTDKSISTFEVQDEALKNIHTRDMRIIANEELKKKRKKRKLEDIELNTDQQKNEKLSAKKKKKEKKMKEKNCLTSSTGTLERLPDSVIVNLGNMPMKKKRKISRNEEHLTSKNIEESMTMTGENSIPSSSSCSHHTSRFTVVNLEQVKKQQSSKVTVIPARQHVSTKNRESVSAYISYLYKQRATSKNTFTANVFQN